MYVYGHNLTKKVINMPNAIGWCDGTLNPITGCTCVVKSHKYAVKQTDMTKDRRKWGEIPPPLMKVWRTYLQTSRYL